MRSLPSYYAITGEDPTQPILFLKKLEQCINGGFELIQLRTKNLDKDQFLNLANKAIDMSNQFHVQLMLNCEIELATKLKAKGVHLTSARLIALNQKPNNIIVSASCHDLLQIKKANSLGLDFVTLSPVLPTLTHPNAKTLGWDAFEKMAREAYMPVYALGGLNANDLLVAKKYGAHGIAAIRAFWG